MPKPPGEGQVWFNARMQASTYERFTNRFPWRGANVWWLNTMMERFLDAVEADPTLEQRMVESLQSFEKDDKAEGVA